MIEHVGVIAIAAASLRGRQANCAGHTRGAGGRVRPSASHSGSTAWRRWRSSAPRSRSWAAWRISRCCRGTISTITSRTGRRASTRRWRSAGVLLAVLAARLAVLYVELVLVMPILLFEDRRGRAAMSESRRRVQGARLRIGAILLGWQPWGRCWAWRWSGDSTGRAACCSSRPRCAGSCWSRWWQRCWPARRSWFRRCRSSWSRSIAC